MMEEDRKSRSAVLEFLKAHGEKAVLGVVAAGCAAYLLLGLNGRDVGAEQVERRIAELERRIREGNRPAPPPVDIPYPDISLPVAAVPGPDWGPFVLPAFRHKVALKPPTMEPKAELLPRLALSASAASPYLVNVTWDVRPYSAAEKAKLKKKAVFPEIDAFVLERAEAGSSTFKVVGKDIKADARSYVDDSVEAEKSYVYRLTPAVAKRRPEKEDGVVSKGAVVVPGVWTIRFNGPNEGRGVYVEIEKIDRVHGKVTVKRFHPVGSRLGWWARRDDQDATPFHYVRKDGESRKVNFDTGVLLESVTRIRTTINVLQCRRIAMPDAVIHEKTTVKRPDSTFEIVLVEDGKRRTVHQPALKDRDERCRAHRGK